MKKIFSALIVSLIPCTTFAAERLGPVTNGMSFNEVLRSRGAPLEKDVHESHRVVLWRYSDGTLKFVNGKLVMFSAMKAKEFHAGSVNVGMPAPKQKPVISQEEVDDIINAIPNDTGNTPGAASAPSAGVGSPQILSEE